MTDSSIMTLKGVGKRVTLPDSTELQILTDLELQIEPGEVVAIVGRSGSGKSTLLNVLGLLDVATSGTYHLQGQDVSSLGDTGRSRLRGAVLGFIFQQFHLLDRRTALENVAEPMLFGPRSELPARFDRATELLAKVGLAERAHSMPHLLSGGEQQRVAIARALCRRPQVILADEPTGALDEITGELILDHLFEAVRQEGVSLVLVTHDSSVAARADRVLQLSSGALQSISRSEGM